MAWEEWDQLKAGAAGQQDTQLQLAGADGGGGGTGGADGTDRLKHSDKPWTDAATVAQSLATSMATGKGELTSAHTGVTSATQGLASAGALKTIRASWEARLDSVRGECHALSPKLRQVVAIQGGSDAGAKEKADSVKVTPSTADDKGR